MSKEVYSKEEVKQELLRRAMEAMQKGNAVDAQKYFDAYNRAEAIEVQADKDAAEYDAKRDAIKAELKSKLAVAGITAVTTLLTGVISAVIKSYIDRGTAYGLEERKESYGLKVQQNHLKAIYEDDIVTRYQDENFKPR